MTEDAPGEGESTDQRGGQDRAVDAVVARLGELDDVPVNDHVEHYERIHSELQDILSQADEA